MKKPKVINMIDVSKDILSLKFKRSDTFNSYLKKFYEIMRKHGIKQGKPTCNDKGEEIGHIVANYEWTAAYTLFLDQINKFFVWEDIFNNKIPKDLLK
jgi:cell shape-determining protein MreC